MNFSRYYRGAFDPNIIKYLIINRKTETVQLMCWAEVYGDNVEIISGVDTPIFGGY